MLLVETTPLANLSDIISLADGVSSEAVRGLSFEPGRLLYHQLEFCSLAHTCVESDSLNSIVIRELIISHTHTHTCSLIHPLTHLLTHMHPHTLTHSSTHSLVFFSCTGTTDTEFTSSSTTVTLTQAAPSNETVVLNKQYNITITTQTGQQYWSVSDIQSSYLWSKLKAK